MIELFNGKTISRPAYEAIMKVVIEKMGRPKTELEWRRYIAETSRLAEAA